MPGLVLQARGGVYEVEVADGRVLEASLRGRLKQEVRTGDRVVAGDRVRLALQEDGGATIEKVEERSSELARRDPRTRGRRAKVIMANADQVVVVFAAARPEPRLRLVDRFLVLAGANHLPATLVVNKLDLADDAETAALFGDYQAAGDELLCTRVEQGRGLDALAERLAGRTSVLTGPSGVGKSSLLNAVEPGLGLRIGEVSRAVGKGRHTTVSALLIPLGSGGYVADTPGLRELGLWDVPAEELDGAFPEMHPYLGSCHFARSCTHTHEPGCAVREAVEEGRLSRTRWESYAALREELAEAQKITD
ncbi:MAG TPA: ribosome small subunit-dependent GTPase A [Longimicrobiales bacterium]|nr:ribosome small subunit-dependent GTPase A [Longimicrobiales bacterium]